MRNIGGSRCNGDDDWPVGTDLISSRIMNGSKWHPRKLFLVIATVDAIYNLVHVLVTVH